MKRLFGPILSIALLTPAALAPALARADLRSDIRGVLQDKLLAKAEVGVVAARLGASAEDVQILYTHNSDIPLIPASNLKVVTTAAALERLGPDFRFRTVALLRDGDLILWGDGDPSLGDAEMLKKVGWDVTTVFKHWAQELKKRNVTTLRDVIVDDSIFDEIFLHPNWPEDQVHKRYVAEVGGVNLNANCLDFYVRVGSFGDVVSYFTNPATRYADVRNTCVGGSSNAIWLSRQPGTNDIILRGETPRSSDVPVSVTIHDPSMFATTVLAETIKSAGITITGAVRRDRTTRQQFSESSPEDQKSKWAVLGIHETPLAQIMSRANKDSMNLYAEALCKRIGAEHARAPGSWENGTAAIADYLTRAVGVKESEFKIDDGCGLSKKNEVSANTMVRVLVHEYAGENAHAFMASLSVAGGDGTLEDRFRSTPDLRGRVFGKSGFVSGVSTLSGYLKGKDEQWYAFSVLINGIPEGTNSGAKVLQERVVRAIDHHVNGNMASGQ